MSSPGTPEGSDGDQRLPPNLLLAEPPLEGGAGIYGGPSHVTSPGPENTLQLCPTVSLSAASRSSQVDSQDELSHHHEKKVLLESFSIFFFS